MDTQASQIRDIVAAQRRFFRTGETLPIAWRIKQLKRLKEAVITHQDEFIMALQEDLGRSELEAYLSEHPYTGQPGKKKMKLLRLFER